MNLFGIGIFEIALVVIVAVIVLGPERFPEVAVQIARAIKWLRGYAAENTRDLRAEFADLTREYELMREELRDVRRQVQAPVESALGETTKVVEKTRTEVDAIRPDRILPGNQAIVEPASDLPDEYKTNSRSSDNGA